MKKASIIILFNLIIFFLLLFIADPIVGRFSKKDFNSKFNKRYVMLKEYPPGVDIEIRPPKDYLLAAQNLPERNYRIRTDKDGYIIGPKNLNKPVDIIFFGGSTTECQYVDENFRFPYLVGQSLQDLSGQPIKTLNAGVSGSNSLHLTINLLSKGVVLKPKVAVLMEDINDLYLLINCRSYWNAPATRAIIQQENTNGKLKNVIVSIKDLLIPNIWDQSKKFINFSPGAKPDEWAGTRTRGFSTAEFADIQSQYRASLLSFINIAKKWGIKPVLMTQFNRLKNDDTFVRKNYMSVQQNISYEDFIRFYSIFNETIREAAKGEQCLLIDLDSKIPHTSEYIYDAIHLNEAGSKLVSHIISKTISDSLRFYKPI